MGDDGVTAYAMVNYIHTVLLMMFYGIGMALQPIVSYHYGAKLMNRVTALLKIGITTALILGFVIVFAAMLFPTQIIAVFGDNTTEIREMASRGFVQFAIGYLFLGINMVFAEFFQSIEKTRLASLIMLLRSILLFVPALIVLPIVFGANAIWWTFPVAESITALLILYYVKKNPKTISS